MAEFQDTGPIDIDIDSKSPIKILCLTRASEHDPLECEHYSCWVKYTRAAGMVMGPPKGSDARDLFRRVRISQLSVEVKSDNPKSWSPGRKFIEPDRIEDAIAILKVAVADGSITKQALFERFSEQSLETVRETLRCLP